MQTVKLLFNAFNYCFYVFYSFTFIDVSKKLLFSELYLDNATNITQLILTVIGVFFAYHKLRVYIRDSRIKTKILEQELISKENENFAGKWNKQFIEPYKKDNNV
jgi:predicted membrane protein